MKMNKKTNNKLTGTAPTTGQKKIEGSGPARATRQDSGMPLMATSSALGERETRMMKGQLKLTGSSNTNRAELQNLRDQIRDLSKASGPGNKGRDRQDKIQSMMAQLNAKYGDGEVAKAVKDFSLTFEGITNDEAVKGKNLGPGTLPSKGAAKNSRGSATGSRLK